MSSECDRWIRVSDARALGQQVPERDVEFQRQHEAICAVCDREALLWKALRPLPVYALPSEREVQRIVDQAGLSVRGIREPPAPASRYRFAAPAFAAALVCAATAALFFRSAQQGGPAGISAPAPQQVLAAAMPPAALTAAEAADPDTARPYPADTCEELSAGVTLCVALGSEIASKQLAGPHRVVTLARGRAIASLEPQPAGTSFSIVSPSGSVTAVGTVFSVEIGDGGRTVARVSEGKVVVRTPGRGDQRLSAGESLRLGAVRPSPLSKAERRRDLQLLMPRGVAAHEARRPVDRSASARQHQRDELARARALRARGEFGRAAAVYRAVHASNPGGTSGRAALVSLGWLSLSSLGDAAGALNAFSQYLAGGRGALTQEAEYGKVRALRALGRTAEARAFSRDFVRRYPRAPESGVLKKQLEGSQSN